MELSSDKWFTTGFVYVACDLAALDAEMVSCLVCQGVGIHWRVVFFTSCVWTDYIFNHADLPIHIKQLRLGVSYCFIFMSEDSLCVVLLTCKLSHFTAVKF